MNTIWFVCVQEFQLSACGDQIIVCVFVCVCVHTGGMPAPEQSSVTEEGLLLTIRDSSTGRNMEPDSTANNILASVKEQVESFFRAPLSHDVSYIVAQLKLLLILYEPMESDI